MVFSEHRLPLSSSVIFVKICFFSGWKGVGAVTRGFSED